MKYLLSAVVASITLGSLILGGLSTGSQVAPTETKVSSITAVSRLLKEKEVSTQSALEPKETTLIFGGDVMLSRGIDMVMRKRNDFVYPFRQIKELTTSADIAVVNLEGPISTQGENQGSIYSFRADPRSIEGLTFAGIDLVSFANNHTSDYGPAALSETLKLLSGAGIAVVGVGKDMAHARAAKFLEVNGLKIAFLGATPLSPLWLTRKNAAPAVAPLNEQLVIEDITSAREQGADIVVVLLHWGNEYETKHLPSQEIIAHHLIDAGATLVIGHHPHVLQEVEEYNGGIIAYSLGNFVFDQNFSPDTHQGVLLKVTLKGKDVAMVEEVAIQFSDSYQPYIKK